MTIQISDGRTVSVEQVSPVGQFGAEYAIKVGAVVNRYITGTREMAEDEAARLAKGIEFDLAH